MAATNECTCNSINDRLAILNESPSPCEKIPRQTYKARSSLFFPARSGWSKPKKSSFAHSCLERSSSSLIGDGFWYVDGMMSANLEPKRRVIYVSDVCTTNSSVVEWPPTLFSRTLFHHSQAVAVFSFEYPQIALPAKSMFTLAYETYRFR